MRGEGGEGEGRGMGVGRGGEEIIDRPDQRNLNNLYHTLLRLQIYHGSGRRPRATLK